MYKLITFDIYSASLDIVGSAVPIVQKVLNASEDFSKLFFQTWRTQQWNYLLLNNSMNDGYKNYRYLTEQVLEYTCKKYDIHLSESQQGELMNIWISFKAWPEAKMVIDEIKNRGYKVAMLSNGDEDMLFPLQKSADITFDYLFSGDQVSCYKPNQKIYHNIFDRLDIGINEHLHVAGSLFDVMGAKAAGINCVWSNRQKEFVLDTRFKADYEISNLKELLNILPSKNNSEEVSHACNT